MKLYLPIERHEVVLVIAFNAVVSAPDARMGLRRFLRKGRAYSNSESGFCEVAKPPPLLTAKTDGKC
jgi:hypothetical protein